MKSHADSSWGGKPGGAAASGNGGDDRALTDSGRSAETGSVASSLSLGAGRLAPAAGDQDTPTADIARTAETLRRVRDLALRHVFAISFILAVALRVAVMIGFQPISWYPDSARYLKIALAGKLSVSKPGGYPGFLALLQPLHSFTLIALLQHLMGLGTGIVIYALLRRRGLPGWAATLPTLPVLFDAFQVQLEHMLMSDTLFTASVVASVVILCWNDRPSVWAAVVAGLLIGFATLTRSAGLPLLLVVVACLLVRGVGWRPAAALAGACALPIAIYMTVFQAEHGTYAITNTDGVYLYDRVMSFANCAKIKPPPSLAILCDPRPQSQRAQPPIEYMWDSRDPIWHLARRSGGVFTPRINSLAMRFAERAILAQPLDYLRAVASDTLRSFGWANPVPYDHSNQWYLFAHPFPMNRMSLREMREYKPGMPGPRVVRPVAGFLIAYQRWVYLRGTLTGLIMLIGLAGIAARWRRRGGLVLLPWAVAAVLLVVPAATAGFSMRYVLGVVPLACLAAGLAVIRERTGPAPQPDGPSAGSLAQQPPLSS
jgi:hypothetical protein